MRRTVNHAEQIGNLQPINLPALPSSSEIRELLEKHETTRPDHLKCMHPDAPLALRQIWSTWCDRKAHLQTKLAMALAQEENRWTDASGNVVTPAPWKYEPTAYVAEQRTKAEQMKDYRARKAAGQVKAPGRPKDAEPSPAALQKRRERAKVPTCTHINERGRVCALHAVPGSAFCSRHVSVPEISGSEPTNPSTSAA